MTQTALGYSRRENESFRDCLTRYATAYGLVDEVLAEFDRCIAEGADDPEAAWQALYEWDLLDLMEADDDDTRH